MSSNWYPTKVFELAVMAHSSVSQHDKSDLIETIRQRDAVIKELRAEIKRLGGEPDFVRSKFGIRSWD